MHSIYTENYVRDMRTEHIKDVEMQQNLYLGEGVAEVEWNKSEDESVGNFIHTESYNLFSKDKFLFLIGRIGTGKTSMLRMLNHQINNNNQRNNKYYTSCILNSEDNMNDLCGNIRLSPYKDLLYGELEHTVSKKWQWLINVAAMRAVIDKANTESVTEDLKAVKKYLEDNKLINDKKSFKYILKTITNEFKNIGDPKIGIALAIANITFTLLSDDYEVAVEQLHKYLTAMNKKVVVMMDTIKLYATDDKIANAVMSSLINATKNIYTENKQVIAKIAMPSEIYDELSTVHREKTGEHTVYIEWKYRDLINLIGRRMAKYYKDIYVKDMDFREYIYDKISETCMTDTQITFDSIAYLIRHTQKKPRQLILIFNTWINLKEQHPKMEDALLLNKAAHSKQGELVEGALSIYTNVSHKIVDIFKRTLCNSRYCFNLSDFDKMLKEASGISEELDSYDLKKVFLSSGLLGIARELHIVNPNDSKLNNKKLIRIKEAIFEYQIKGTLPYNNKTLFVIHPMCYQYFSCEVDYNTFVYPKPAEDEEEDFLGLNP